MNDVLFLMLGMCCFGAGYLLIAGCARLMPASATSRLHAASIRGGTP